MPSSKQRKQRIAIARKADDWQNIVPAQQPKMVTRIELHQKTEFGVKISEGILTFPPVYAR